MSITFDEAAKQVLDAAETLKKACDNLVDFAAKDTRPKTEQGQKNVAQARKNAEVLGTAKNNITQLTHKKEQQLGATKTVSNENTSGPRPK